MSSKKQTPNQLSHTYNVLLNTQKLSKSIIDVETGQRGFLITGKENFLEPFYKGLTRIEKLMIDTKQLVSDNPAQVKRLQQMEELIEKWLTLAGNKEIELRKLVRSQAKDARFLAMLLGQGTGKNILDKIRQTLNTLNQHFHAADNNAADKNSCFDCQKLGRPRDRSTRLPYYW